MILNTLKISDGSQDYVFTGDKAPWVLDCAHETLLHAFRQESAAQVRFEFMLIKSCETITVEGRIHVPFQPECVRCLEPFTTTADIPIRTHLMPAPKVEYSAKKSGREIELTVDDLEFSYYEHHEIDLKEILRQEMLLNAPQRLLCQPGCRGLCAQCGINLNHGSCDCQLGPEDLRWAPLRELKL
jgi:uncharacterized protein